ncbi:MAG: type II toxin-antitoxin system PemK/MazF family toxin [Mycobacteriales bacterium]
MFRGDVWDVQLPAPIGSRPCVVLTTNALISRLGAVTIVEVTSTQGPSVTHIELPADTGLSGSERSWANATGLHTVPKGKLRRHRGRLAPTELARLGEAVGRYLGLES